MNIRQAADALGVATSTIHRWLDDGIIGGEHLTAGAPVAHSFNRRFARSRWRRSAGKLPHCVSNNATIARFQADSVAAAR
jgi:hypothetical protein